MRRKYVCRKRAHEVFMMGIPYRVEAEPFGEDMADGYHVQRIVGNYPPVRIRKEYMRKSLWQDYYMLSYCLITSLGAVDINIGDYVVYDDSGAKIAAKKTTFEKYYMEDDSDGKEKRTVSAAELE